MNKQQEDAFWETIDVFDAEGLLPHIMLIGSWAEYIYGYYFETDFNPNLKTRDLDFLYKNIGQPKNKIYIISKLNEKGFIYKEDVLTGVGKFFKENLLEVEFLARSFGKGSSIINIPSIGITAESLCTVNMLVDYPLVLDCKDYAITVPEPAAYVLQKLYTNPTRKKEKQEKDIRAVRALLKHFKESARDHERLKIILDKLPKKHQKTILETANKNFIEL